MPELEVIINIEGLADAPSELLEEGVRHALADAAIDAAEISVTLLDDDGIQALNRDYLDRDRPTDVIAFSLGAEDTLGDVYIGVDRARSQAAEHGVDIEEELLRLAIHGTLHVLGHDHPEGPERMQSEMFELQERLVSEVLAR